MRGEATATLGYPLPMDPREQAAAFDFRELWRADASAKGPRPLSEYLARFPGHDAAIVREWQQLTAPVPATPDTAAVDGKHEELPSLGPYRLVDVLGQGGQGTVYLAEATRLQNRSGALKVLDAVALGLSSARRQRLRREAEALARLDHPGVCGIYEAQLEGPRPYLAMRYVQGPTLQEALAQNIAAPSTTEDLHRVLHCIERTALAAHAAHESGIVHRDIKPANIILDRDGRPVLLDFGLARDEDPESLALTLSGDVFGTLAYMAPEQVTGGRDLDRRVDVYALGVTLYECLTLAQPFSAPTRDAVMGNIKAGRSRDVRALNPAVSRDLAVVVAKAMEVARGSSRRHSVRRTPSDRRPPQELRPARAALDPAPPGGDRHAVRAHLGARHGLGALVADATAGASAARLEARA